MSLNGGTDYPRGVWSLPVEEEPYQNFLEADEDANLESEQAVTEDEYEISESETGNTTDLLIGKLGDFFDLGLSPNISLLEDYEAEEEELEEGAHDSPSLGQLILGNLTHIKEGKATATQSLPMAQGLTDFKYSIRVQLETE